LKVERQKKEGKTIKNEKRGKSLIRMRQMMIQSEMEIEV
jgi:hypothetical protein